MASMAAAEAVDLSPRKSPAGCGIFNGVLRGRCLRHRKAASVSSIPISKLNIVSSWKRRRGGSDEILFLDTSNLAETSPKQAEKPNTKSTIIHAKTPNRHNGYPNSVNATPTTSSPLSNGSITRVTGHGRRAPPKDAVNISNELDSLIVDHQRSKDSHTLIRASSSNVMLFGQLGNLRQTQPVVANGHSNSGNYATSASNGLDYNSNRNGKCNASHRRINSNGVMGNIIRKSSNEMESGLSTCRALSKSPDPEKLKMMAAEEFKKGRLAEALALYDHAIALRPEMASYHSNKSTVLAAMGRLLEAVLECREAITIDPCYQRAHHRLATLLLRLGEAEKAVDHLKQSGQEAKSDEIAQAEVLQTHVNKFNEARKQKDWITVLKETDRAISSGADSALQIFSFKAEAQLMLHRHDDANNTLSNAPTFDIEDCTKFFGSTGNAKLLSIRAQVEMAAGRVDEAVAWAQQAARIDPLNKEIGTVVRKARAVAWARTNGNELYKTSKFQEACVAYSQGLDHDPLNAVLLCNRAACRFKLGQFERAAEDCTKALSLRPSYSKATLRRADCYAKMERWEASIHDYETVMRETPGDEEVARALFQAQVELKKQKGEDVTDMKFGAEVIVIPTIHRFRRLITSPGMSVVLFSNKSSEKQAMRHLEQLCKRYPSVNFMKVDVEDHPYLAKVESASSVPAFKIYRNGSRVKEIPGHSQDLLESSIKFYST